MDWIKWETNKEDLFLIALLIIFFLLLRLRSWNLKPSKLKFHYAPILSLEPYFGRSNHLQHKTSFVLCCYKDSNNKIARCLLPLKSFLPKERRLQVLFHSELDLPVLSYRQVHLLGNRAIQHHLLQTKKDILLSEKLNAKKMYTIKEKGMRTIYNEDSDFTNSWYFFLARYYHELKNRLNF